MVFPIIVSDGPFYNKKLKCCECKATWFLEHAGEAIKHAKKKHRYDINSLDPSDLKRGLI